MVQSIRKSLAVGPTFNTTDIGPADRCHGTWYRECIRKSLTVSLTRDIGPAGDDEYHEPLLPILFIVAANVRRGLLIVDSFVIGSIVSHEGSFYGWTFSKVDQGFKS